MRLDRERSLADKSREGLRTWIELRKSAVAHNVRAFRRCIGSRVKLFAVVKSNAYGHGLSVFSNLVNRLGVDGFCVDSVVEALRLRGDGIRKPVLVLGPTLPERYGEAARGQIMVSIATFEALRYLGSLDHPPLFHVKIDTGMHRQGFRVHDVPRLIREIQAYGPGFVKALHGVYTHFASAKDINYPTYTQRQLRAYKETLRFFARARLAPLLRHAAATGGTLLGNQYHFDAVRVGIGLYGLYPSKELEIQLRPFEGSTQAADSIAGLRPVALDPVLRWRTVISEVKKLERGDYIGYDLVERMRRPTTVAVLPIGYWHGLPRALSEVGEVLVRGRRARVLGRISMDLTVVDVTDSSAAVGDCVTLIGRDRNDELAAVDVAARAGTIHYELLTRLNPLMERVVVR